MPVENVFLVGMPKSGTTALSNWIVKNGLAEDRVPGEKEPHLYVNDQPHPLRVRTTDLPLLDASTAYACNPAAIQRLPEFNTRLVLCLRNQFERAWSAYKMWRLFVSGDGQAESYFQSYHSNLETGRIERNRQELFERRHELHKQHYPRRSHAIIERYGDLELERMRHQDFAARIDYEIGFYLSRREFPLFSVVVMSFYYVGLKAMLDKFQPSDITVVSVSALNDAEKRRRFVKAVFDKDIDTPPLSMDFSSAGLEIDMPKPEFDGEQFDALRSYFRYDLQNARELIARTHLGDALLDDVALDRYLSVR